MGTVIHSPSDLNDLVRSAPGREDFGPTSPRPCLVLDLSDDISSQAGWLRQLPCPVIGIGENGFGKECDLVFAGEEDARAAIENVNRWPIAAMVLVQHLRLAEHLGPTDALVAESLAYATLQKGPEFLQWYSKNLASRSELSPPAEPLQTKLLEGELVIKLSDPDRKNVIDTGMRDALCEALDLALTDDAIRRVRLQADGPCFSVGGAVDEFGTISDPASAHWIRSLRLPAFRLAQLGERLRVRVEGAAIGAGAEIAGFGHRVTARQDAWFQLPELKYGLIPGAGGTVSLARRIGRQRVAEMALSMRRIRAQTALDWGLVDEIVS